jgi:hypothetical protein
MFDLEPKSRANLTFKEGDRTIDMKMKLIVIQR